MQNIEANCRMLNIIVYNNNIRLREEQQLMTNEQLLYIEETTGYEFAEILEDLKNKGVITYLQYKEFSNDRF